MFKTISLLTSLACGQLLGPPQPNPSPPGAYVGTTAAAAPAYGGYQVIPVAAPQATRPATAAMGGYQFMPSGQPAASPSPARPIAYQTLPPVLGVPATAPDGSQVIITTGQQPDTKAPDTPPGPTGDTQGTAPEPTAAPPPEAPPAPAAPAPDRWFTMKYLQGTAPGTWMFTNRMQVWGWDTASFTPSTSNTDNNLPTVWNDRANKFLVNQHWTRFEQTVVTSGTTAPTFGFRVDVLYGTDYRYTLARGELTSQLQNSQGNQNLYGVDSLAHYAEWYIPTLFQGFDIKVGRFFTPFGYESLETISSPLVSKSYSFNWFPPFTHYGILTTAIINPRWKVQAGLINGNDVALGNPSEEARFLGTVTYTAPNLRDVVTFGTSMGRGSMNTGAPFNPATFGLQSEPAGRNNINVVDLVWTHVINPRINYAMEVDYGWQSAVPANVPGGIIYPGRVSGTAHWGGICQYLFTNITPKLTQVNRFEVWDDFEGQRTGFAGCYITPTVGLVYKPYPWLWWRQEFRYDYNGYSRAFSNGTVHDQLTAGMDWTIRW